jgi:hypothetical protein
MSSFRYGKRNHPLTVDDPHHDFVLGSEVSRASIRAAMESLTANLDKTPRPLLRPLLPSTAPRGESTSLPPKRHRVSLACAACRGRKTKVRCRQLIVNDITQSLTESFQCDGRRPKCHECVSRESQCQYTETETALQKRKHEDLEALFDMFRSFPEQEANDLLVRIRAGQDPSLLVEQVRTGSVLMAILSSNRECRGSQGTSTSSPSP